MPTIQQSTDNKIVPASNHLIERAEQRIEEKHGRMITAKLNNPHDYIQKEPKIGESIDIKG